MWDRPWLSDLGFSGFIPLLALDASRVPTTRGVYVVLRRSSDPPTFLKSSPVTSHNGKSLSYTTVDLAGRWVNGATVLNIGKAAGEGGLRGRLSKYGSFGSGQPASHRGGRSVWQLQDHAQLLVAWLETPNADPEDVEGELLDAFQQFYGVAPFANRRGRRKLTKSSWRLFK